MLNAVELGVLDGCANHYELFYFLFAEVNYGGQVVRKSPEGEPGISVPGDEVARHAQRLIEAGLMRCWRIRDDPGDNGPFLTPEDQTAGLYRERVEITQPGEPEFAAYRGYDCVTFEEHLERFGQGPHEFRITRSGIDEIERPEYEALYQER
ncbi:hypothetical protein [Rubrobacter aplysinae]|uniref:hypothetical protein n=1 Tax=Rubrobacter aplysinae TaxID=909625 RepID=UPI00064C0B39|nr:hypothetical protein [Rubrobacter aplysinae]